MNQNIKALCGELLGVKAQRLNILTVICRAHITSVHPPGHFLLRKAKAAKLLGTAPLQAFASQGMSSL